MSYRDDVRALALSLGGDGCTHASEVNQVCCDEHDVAYALGQTPRGVPITKAQADRRFRDCNAAHSPLKFLSPLAWLRWTAVHWFGRTHVAPPPLVLTALGAHTRPTVITALAEAKAARERMLHP